MGRIADAWKALTSKKDLVSFDGYPDGTKSGHVFDGSKFSGSLLYPSNWSFDGETLRQRSRIAYWDSTQARSLISRLCDNVIGTGLGLESSPIWPLIGGGLTDEQKHEFARDIELRFHLWANSKESDAAGKMSFYELQDFEFRNRLRDGETISILRYSGDAARMSPLSIQFILPDDVTTPSDSGRKQAAEAIGNRIVDGIEIESTGREVALYVADQNGKNHNRIPVNGTSRRFVLHPIISDTLGAVRGMPLLAPLIHELQKITDYTVAEIEAAVINAVLAVWVEPGPDAPASRALAGIRRSGQEQGQTNSESATQSSRASFDKPGLIVQTLKAGEKIQSFDTKRPNVNFGEFVRHITRHISASVGVPIEVLEMSFNANYSASRASLLLFWTAVEKWRDSCASQFLGPIFEAWFSEEVKAGRINAPGFLTGSPLIRRSWLNCLWIGASQPSIDPLKEANAVGARIQMGHTTNEREAQKFNGSDFTENAKRLKMENQLLKEAGVLIETQEMGQTTQDLQQDAENDN